MRTAQAWTLGKNPVTENGEKLWRPETNTRLWINFTLQAYQTRSLSTEVNQQTADWL